MIVSWVGIESGPVDYFTWEIGVPFLVVLVCGEIGLLKCADRLSFSNISLMVANLLSSFSCNLSIVAFPLVAVFPSSFPL